MRCGTGVQSAERAGSQKKVKARRREGGLAFGD